MAIFSPGGKVSEKVHVTRFSHMCEKFHLTGGKVGEKGVITHFSPYATDPPATRCRWVGEVTVTRELDNASKKKGVDSPRTRTRKELYGMTEASTVEEEKGKGQAAPVVPPPTVGKDEPIKQLPNLGSTLDTASSALARTIEKIATSLDDLVLKPTEHGRYFVDVKLHTEALKDILDVMDRLGRLPREGNNQEVVP
ncbi:hypothetical protein M231_07750 [Tremella mesenterica]|uniref:Uncharacterized protein n=1 Tax=Tremella mesenterica TaxID=5217 RepID=A0A4Q1BB99_TREME|nr:hypothetical protein M231_07750 [Tremella mesenterica]